MIRWLVAAAIGAFPAFGERPKEIDNYVQRFRDAGEVQLGFKIQAHLFDLINFQVKPLFNYRSRRLGEKWWFAEYRPDGMCDRSTATIYLDSKMWRSSDDLYKEMVVFHEIGHCLLAYEHDPRMANKVPGSPPLSIMHPMGPDYRSYLMNRGAYLQNLFAPAKAKVYGVKKERFFTRKILSPVPIRFRIGVTRVIGTLLINERLH